MHQNDDSKAQLLADLFPAPEEVSHAALSRTDTAIGRVMPPEGEGIAARLPAQCARITNPCGEFWPEGLGKWHVGVDFSALELREIALSGIRNRIVHIDIAGGRDVQMAALYGRRGGEPGIVALWPEGERAMPTAYHPSHADLISSWRSIVDSLRVAEALRKDRKGE